jgi:hypothetical protein
MSRSIGAKIVQINHEQSPRQSEINILVVTPVSYSGNPDTILDTSLLTPPDLNHLIHYAMRMDCEGNTRSSYSQVW